MAKVLVKKGDNVRVISGDDVGRSGKVIAVDRARGRVTIEGVNIQKRHSRPSRSNPQGGVIEQPGPIHVSNVAIECPSCGDPVQVRRDRSEDGGGARVCKACGKSID